MTMKRFAPFVLTALVAGCSTVELPQIGKPTPDTDTTAVPSRAPAGKLKPMPLRTFTLRTDCKFRDETGNFGSATLDVENSKVKAFRAELTMPRRGSCRYDLSQFRQTQALPSIELTGARDCRVHMWEQGNQITVAFANCHQLCSPASAQDYVWPLLIDKTTGQCD